MSGVGTGNCMLVVEADVVVSAIVMVVVVAGVDVVVFVVESFDFKVVDLLVFLMSLK